MVQEIRKKYKVPASVQIRFIVRNTETIVEECARELGRRVPRKDRIDRDSMLESAAAADSSVRGRILERVPSLKRLVELLTEVYEASRTAEAAGKTDTEA